MGNITVFKTAQNMGNGVNFSDIGKKLIAQPFAFASTSDKTRDIYKLKLSWQDLGGFCNGS